MFVTVSYGQSDFQKLRDQGSKPVMKTDIILVNKNDYEYEPYDTSVKLDVRVQDNLSDYIVKPNYIDLESSYLISDDYIQRQIKELLREVEIERRKPKYMSMEEIKNQMKTKEYDNR